MDHYGGEAGGKGFCERTHGTIAEDIPRAEEGLGSQSASN